MSSVSKTKASDRHKRKKKEPVRPYFKASLEHAQWVLTQAAPVQQLWIECQVAERFGGKDWRKLCTTLAESTFRKAKAILEKKGLFAFDPITSVSEKGRRIVVGWLVHNNYGYWNKSYFEDYSLPSEQAQSEQSENEIEGANLIPTEQPCSVESEEEIESQAEQEVETVQLSISQDSATSQLPTRVDEKENVLDNPPSTQHLRGAANNDGYKNLELQERINQLLVLEIECGTYQQGMQTLVAVRGSSMTVDEFMQQPLESFTTHPVESNVEIEGKNKCRAIVAAIAQRNNKAKYI